MLSAVQFHYKDYRLQLFTITLPESYGGTISEKKYTLSEEVHLSEQEYFYLELENEKPLEISIEQNLYYIPGSTDSKRIYIKEAFSNPIRTFQIQSDSIYRLLEAGIVQSPLENVNTLIWQGSEILIDNEQENKAIDLLFLSETNSEVENIRVTDALNNQFAIRTRKGENPYRFTDAPIKINMNDSSLDFVNFELENLNNEAILSDLENLVYFSQNDWRQKDYEIFQWNLFPSMIIMDTADYDVQSDFFKRLAFFTEKKVSAGTLLSDEELMGLHGWNAHDYKAPDLARFYNEASKMDFPLNERELELKQILLDNGVLKESSGRLRALSGGILSFSRESSERLRWLFLTHECYHGIFFDSQDYAQSVVEIWENITDVEKYFWRSFLDMYGYNVSDEYLLINEFQAYLMQQDVTGAEAYFKGKIRWILNLRPFMLNQLKPLLDPESNYFEIRAREVENAAYSLTGIRAGDLVLKTKK